MVKEKKSFTLQLRNLEIIESAINAPKPGSPKPDQIQFDLNIKHRFIIQKQLVAVQIDIQMADKDRYQLGSIKTACIFEIEDFNKYLNAEKTELKLPDDIILMLNNISISTSRGIMFTHFRGTHLHNAILPLINPAGLKKEKGKEK